MSALVTTIPIADLDEGPNVRRRADTGLRRSIAKHGVLQPITVCVADEDRERFQVLYGHRRLAAARSLGLTSIPAVVVVRPAEDLPIRQLAENLDRQTVSPIDVAKALRAHLDAHPEQTAHDLAAQLGRSDYWISVKLRLLDMSPALRQRVDSKEIGEGRAYAIHKASLPRTGTGRPKTLPGLEEGRSRSIVVPLGQAAGKGAGPITATVGIDEDRCIDLVVDNGRGQAVMVTIDEAGARLLSRRLMQASQAVAS
jgi:ParB/RepB/Spo0J family partition protein